MSHSKNVGLFTAQPLRLQNNLPRPKFSKPALKLLISWRLSSKAARWDCSGVLVWERPCFYRNSFAMWQKNLAEPLCLRVWGNEAAKEMIYIMKCLNRALFQKPRLSLDR